MSTFDCIVGFVPDTRRSALRGLWVCVLWVIGGLSSATLSADEPIDQLIRQLHQPVASARIEAAKQLARYGQAATSAVPALIQALEDDQSDVRLASSYALGCIPGDHSQIVSAIIPLLTDVDEHVRYSAEWSMARIASGLEVGEDVGLARDMLPLLETAVEHLSKREHQPRHRIAIELAIAKLTKAHEAAQPVAPTAQQEPAPAETSTTDLAARVYAASDLLARYQFAEQLRDLENYPDSMRRFVIDFESQSGDTRVLRYAVSRWGDHGQSILSNMLNEMSSQGTLDIASAAVIELVKPSVPLHCDQLMRVAANRHQPVEVRLAAMQALSVCKSIERPCLESWLAILAASDEDSELRIAAADALGELGTIAAKAETGLISLLQKTQDDAMRGALCKALSKVASSSPAAAQAVHEALSAGTTDDVAYTEIIDACGCFRTLAAGSAQQLIEGLQHGDEAVRSSSAKSLALIGQAAAGAGEILVEQISNAGESIRVKNKAAQALRELGPKALTKLIDRLQQTGDETELEHSLRALAIAGPQASQASGQCLAMLSDERLPTRVRAAAATALGAMGKPAARASATLVRLCDDGQADELRAASLMALARIDPRAAKKSIEQCSEDASVLVRASAAYATVLCDDAQQGFKNLLALLDGSETDWIIEQAIADIGSIAHPWLIETASDVRATDQQRLVCFRLGYRIDAASRAALLPCLADATLGDQFVENVDAETSEDIETTAVVLAALRSEDLQSAARARITGLLTPDGLGAGGDEEDWQGPTLTLPSAVDALTAAEQASASELSTLPAMNPGSPSGSGVPEHSGGAPIRPALPVRATGPYGDSAQNDPNQYESSRNEFVANDSTAAPREPQLVKVFYGTNRARLKIDETQHELAVSVLATAGGSLLVMILCLVGFLRSGNRAFATVALLAIGIVAPFGYLAANKYSRASQHAPVAYGVDYQPKVELGVCEVSIPPGHKPGMLEAPNIFKLEINQDVNKHVVLKDVAELSPSQFYDNLQSTMSAKGKNVLVFIHGYNVSFDDAARRTAQMALDLKFPGAPVFYSWPSQANWYGYTVDKENIQQSVGQIKSFLLDLASKSGADTINLVAHSMGNVGLTQALKEMEGAAPQPLFNQVVLAAPDIDAEVFKTGIAPHIITKAQHVTLYTSQTDLALVASRYFNHGTRLGDSGSGALVYPGIDTIDATDVDSSLLGHSYYGSNVTVLTDVARVLENQPIASRQYLRAIIDAAQPYWAFDPLRISQLPDPAGVR